MNGPADDPKRSEAALREKDEPILGSRPAPLWLIPVIGALLFWGAGYLFLFSGGFRGDVFNEEAGLYGPGDAEGPVTDADPVASGRRIYNINCAICHQTTGLGVPGQYPSLAGSEIVLGTGGFGENHAARIVLDGLTGPVTVKGAAFNGIMVPWRDVLNDAQIAAVLTYVRQAWGNGAGPIAAEGIAALRGSSAERHGPWTFTTLREIAPEALPHATPTVPK